MAPETRAVIIAARGKLHDLLCLPKHEAGDVARQWAAETYGMLGFLIDLDDDPASLEEMAAEAEE